MNFYLFQKNCLNLYLIHPLLLNLSQAYFLFPGLQSVVCILPHLFFHLQTKYLVGPLNSSQSVSEPPLLLGHPLDLNDSRERNQE